MKRALRRIFVAAAVLLALGVSGIMCTRVGERGRYVGAYSTYGSGPEGTRGLFLLGQELGAEPQRWAEDLGRLPPGAMLIALGSCQEWMRRDIGRIERENLQAWVAEGGTLVVAGVPDYLTRDAFGVELVAEQGECRPTAGIIGMLDRDEQRGQRKRVTRPGDDDLQRLPDSFSDDPVGTYEDLVEEDGVAPPELAFGSGAPFGELPAVGLRRPLHIQVDDEHSHGTLLRLDGPEGRPVGMRVDVGEGAVIVLASASMFQNRDLAAERGGVLFARLVEEHGGPVLFDEYHLGVGQRRSMMRYLRQAGVAPLVVQFLLLVLLVLWRLGAVFGAHREDAPPDPAGTASYVEGVGALYAKAKDPRGTAAILIRRAIEQIAEHHHLRERDPARLADALEARRRPDAADAVRAIAASEAEAAERGGLARLVARIDELCRVAMSPAPPAPSPDGP